MLYFVPVGDACACICCATYDCLQDNRTALIWASFHGRADCVRLLLGAGADKNAKDKVRGRSVGRSLHLRLLLHLYLHESHLGIGGDYSRASGNLHDSDS